MEIVTRPKSKESGWTPVKAARVLFYVMIVAVIVNFLQFASIEDQTRHNYRAIQLYDTGDIFEIAISRDNNARRFVAPFHFFGQMFPGSTVIIPSEGISSRFNFEPAMVAFGKVAQIRRASYDPVSLIDLAQLDAYRIPVEAFAPNTNPTLRLVEERVSYYLSEDGGEVFVLVTPDGTPGREGHLAFVDAALIPELREELAP